MYFLVNVTDNGSNSAHNWQRTHQALSVVSDFSSKSNLEFRLGLWSIKSESVVAPLRPEIKWDWDMEK